MKRLLWVMCVIIIASTLFSELKKGLLIESYTADYSWDKDYSTTLISDLKDVAKVDIFYMDTKRIPKEEFAKKAEEAWNKFNSVKYDFVVLGDDNALKFMAEKLSKTTVPVFFLGINNNPRAYFGGKDLPANFTGVLERPLIKRSIAYIKEFSPEVKKMLVLFDNGETSEIVKNENFGNELKTKISEIDVEVKLIGDFDKWKEEINRVNTQFDAVVIGLYQTLKDGNGKSVSDTEVLTWSMQNLKKKPFCFWEFTVGKDKAIGGYVISAKEQGKKAAEMIKSYYAKKTLPEIEIPEKGKLVFSKSGLEKWGIKLPDKIKSEATIIE